MNVKRAHAGEALHSNLKLFVFKLPVRKVSGKAPRSQQVISLSYAKTWLLCEIINSASVIWMMNNYDVNLLLTLGFPMAELLWNGRCGGLKHERRNVLVIYQAANATHMVLIHGRE